MPAIVIPDKTKTGGELLVKADNPKNILIILYDSPRSSFAEDDIKNEKPIWDGDPIKLSGINDSSEKGVFLKLVRGAENKPLLTGRYLIRAFDWTTREVLAEKIIELTSL